MKGLDRPRQKSHDAGWATHIWAIARCRFPQRLGGAAQISLDTTYITALHK
jgi:hypothetical protein